MNHVSEHEILKRENASQPKWSMALEWQKQCNDNLQPKDPAAENEDSTVPVVYDGHVMKGFTDGHIAVIGHGC